VIRIMGAVSLGVRDADHMCHGTTAWAQDPGRGEFPKQGKGWLSEGSGNAIQQKVPGLRRGNQDRPRPFLWTRSASSRLRKEVMPARACFSNCDRALL
jgi:hypothetical protein